MSSPIKTLVDSVPVAEIIARDFELDRGGRRYYRGVKHDSLIVDIDKNIFYWNSIDIVGNALDWLLKIKGMAFVDAVNLLRQYAGTKVKRSFDSLFQPQYPYQKLLDAFYNLGKTNRQYWYYPISTSIP